MRNRQCCHYQNQLLSLCFKRKWPQPNLRAQPAMGRCARSVRGSWAFWIRVFVWRRVRSSLWGWGISCAGTGGYGLKCMDIAGSGGQGNPYLAIDLDLLFSKCWNVNGTCHYESCWIFCHETTNEFDSHHIHQLMEQIYPSFLKLSLSEWDFTHG